MINKYSFLVKIFGMENGGDIFSYYNLLNIAYVHHEQCLQNEYLSDDDK